MKEKMKVAGCVCLCVLKVYVFMILVGIVLGLPIMGLASYFFHVTELTKTVIISNVGNFGTIIFAYFWYKWNKEDMFEDCEIRTTSKSFMKVFQQNGIILYYRF